MTRRWTPRRFVTLRRVRVTACVVSLTLASMLAFGVGARKTVALTIDGETTTVTTYAMSVDRLLQERGVKVKTHDLVESTSPTSMLSNHDVVTVRSAYQTTITINGQEVPFWTVATSAEQLIGFFEQNEADAAKVTVSIDNVYNKLTGGLIINQNGPVTVISDGQSSEAPNGKLPAASILDSKGITLNKEDRVSVEKDNGETILRVRRVTHGEETRTKAVPFGTQTIIDPSLQPGEVVVRQEGEEGEIQQTYDVTYVDGEKESETLTNETTTKIALDRIVAVGPAASSDDSGSDGGSGNSGDAGNSDNSGKNDNSDKNSNSDNSDKKNDSNNNSDNTDNSGDNKKDDSTKDDSGSKTDPDPTPTPDPTPHAESDAHAESDPYAHPDTATFRSFSGMPPLPPLPRAGTGLRGRSRGAIWLDRTKLDRSGETVDPRIELAVVCGKRIFRSLRHPAIASRQQNGGIRRTLA
ncbi:G5 domain protein [Bifidobacterium catenulatum subsp. kashiwanohense JCM 15439 = DSM 21854]|nr:G5 domain protein [Bifidobacterium catenulatum subsp. kashiwanohense JCM 15439 = DSM 21854]